MSAVRLGVAGWPVAHSRSPQMQNAALAAAGLRDWRYQLLPLPPELFGETVPALPAAGFRGINVTIPHKQRALELALATGAAVSDRARAIGAVNTLVFGPQRIAAADNTDAPALTAALDRRLPDGLAGATALVLGAGGSARAAVWALLDAGAAQVRVWNRSPQRAQALCDAFDGAIPAGTAQPADILVNCTAVGLDAVAQDAELAELPIDPDALRYRVVVDFVYREGATALFAAARRQGLPAIDGLELLIGQGALSFEQFTGVPADLDAMRAAAAAAGALSSAP